MKRLFPLLLVFLLALLGLGAWLAHGAWQWWRAPLELGAESVEFTVPSGMPLQAVAQGWVAAGVRSDARQLYWAWRLSGEAPRLRAGSYAAVAGDSPERLLQKMVRGEELLEPLQLLEGWTFAEVRRALARQPHLRQIVTGLSDAELMTRLGRPGQSPEGRFFPDTYKHGRGVDDLTVLRQALAAMDTQLERAWAARTPDSPLRSADELLKLASIIEKETGRDADRPMVASVFSNRLRIGMRLQTDPTVIFGLGERFDGNLRKVDLLTDTPYNSYTRAGLPPTPIALPGRASLMAAAQPARSQALYFVARGDGSSEFSDNLAAHNRAVARFQLQR
ncbi:MAG: endolytic transglycosylase MltG [Burkholderiales bacterium]|nr:endolytic transglycosylase MltG [Burkholderiales bacterium]